jgi:hypothetical protein
MARKSGSAERISRAAAFRGDLARFLNEYHHQPVLTGRLDNLLNVEINQELLNEIVLWKVNRYVCMTSELERDIGRLKGLKPGQHRRGESVLAALLDIHGVDVAMASTILRFRNPPVFQILDRHAYRALYGLDFPLNTKSSDQRKIDLYFRYVDDLRALCVARGLAFETVDRVLYIFDKRMNGTLKKS